MYTITWRIYTAHATVAASVATTVAATYPAQHVLNVSAM